MGCISKTPHHGSDAESLRTVEGRGEDSVSKAEELIHDLIWQGENSDMSCTGKEPVVDGEGVQCRCELQRDEVLYP